MANIRVNVDYTIKDGTELVFRSPCDCTEITGLIVYYATENGTASKEFTLADAHGENVGDVPHLFAGNVVVKVILDLDSGMAFVQNADTNTYLEAQLAEKAPIDHTHTASDVGAAPAGFGLGGDSHYVTNLDDATSNGWYCWTTGAVNAPFEYGSLLVLRRGTRRTQIAVDPYMVGHGGIVIRHQNGSQWLSWQWLNPPMTQGEEYLLVERYNGKSVYTKIIDFGALPNNASKNVGTGVDESKIIRAEIMVNNGTNCFQLPYFLADGTLIAKHLFNSTNVQITTSKDYTGYTGSVHIWYTK